MRPTVETFSPDDIDAVMDIWLSGNKSAHPFIDSSVWESMLGECRALIPQADVRVWRRGGKACAFIGITLRENGGYVAGLFVDAAHRSHGIGSALLAAAKADYPRLTLHVFDENPRAIAFYEREGFARAGLAPSDMAPAHKEWLMEWARA